MTTASAIAQLEQTFAALHSAPGAVATGFGRGALYLALEAIAVRNADVLVPDFICQQVLHAIEQAGGRPIFYDVPLDLAVSPGALAAAITPQTRAAIVVHYFGAPQPHVAELVAACREGGIATIEDCSLALLAAHPAGLCGAFGDYATFSFTKNNWCYGGGMALARDPRAVESMRALRAQQFTPDEALCSAYGRLSQLDFEANRPSRAHAAAEEGARLQRELARSDSRFRTENFFDVPHCRVAMSPAAAERALEILRGEQAAATLRKAHVDRLIGAAQQDGNGSFIVIRGEEGSAQRRIAEADARGITLRPVWPAFQNGVPRTDHAGRMVTLEIHPELEVDEIEAVKTLLAGFER